MKKYKEVTGIFNGQIVKYMENVSVRMISRISSNTIEKIKYVDKIILLLQKYNIKGY